MLYLQIYSSLLIMNIPLFYLNNLERGCIIHVIADKDPNQQRKIGYEYVQPVLVTNIIEFIKHQRIENTKTYNHTHYDKLSRLLCRLQVYNIIDRNDKFKTTHALN